MTRAEAWETLEDLEFLCRYIDGTESSIVYNTIVKSDRYKGIGQRLKTLKEQIINDNDADLARKIYSLVHEDKFEGGNICNAFYRLSVDLENEKEFAEEMELCNKVLTDISYWLLESVYGIPKDKSYAYYIKDGEVKVRRGIPKKRYPSAMPRELNTEKFVLILQKAMESGFCDKKEINDVFCYKWAKSKSLLAYFADRCTEALGLSPSANETVDEKGGKYLKPTTCFYPFEELFGIEKNSLRKLKNNYENSTRGFPRGYEQLDAIFDELGC